HADQRPVPDGELRSEWVTVVADGGGEAVLVGFDGGPRHDGIIRVRRSDGGVEVVTAAVLGDAVLAPGERRALRDVVVDDGGGDARTTDAPALLARWAADVGDRHHARVDAPFQVGWCSWYHYFHDITEAALLDNLGRAGDWPFDVFQLDDGYQSAIGDW